MLSYDKYMCNLFNQASLKNISVGANISLKLMVTVRPVGNVFFFFFLRQVQLGQTKRASVLADTVTAKKFDLDSYEIPINKQFLQLVTG